MKTLSRGPVAGVLVVLLVSAGCLGVLTGDEPLTFSADPVSVTTGAQSDTGYEEARSTTIELDREFSAAGQTRQVVVTNYVAEYARTVEAGAFGSKDLARFVVVSTPAVKILDRTFNPVGEMSERELVELAQDQYAGLQNVQQTGERTVTVLDSSATVAEFSAEATVEGTGQTIDVTLHVTRIRHGSDFVIAIGAHPTLLPDESNRVDRLLQGIQHSG